MATKGRRWRRFRNIWQPEDIYLMTSWEMSTRLGNLSSDMSLKVAFLTKSLRRLSLHCRKIWVLSRAER
jgi:hypothetical protein